MADTYKGESLGKKIARAWFWICAREYLGDRFYTGNHLVLASREGGDVAVLKAMGVAPKRIFAMEISKSAAAEFAAKHPDVNLRVGDVAQTVVDKQIRGTLVCAHLDFCPWFTQNVFDTAVRVARFGLVDRGVLSIGVMKGRESGTAASTIKSHTANCQEDATRASLYENAESRRWGARVDTSMARLKFVYNALRKELVYGAGPMVSPICQQSIGYSSGVTPMLFSVFSILRDTSRRALFKRAEHELREWLRVWGETADVGNFGPIPVVDCYRWADSFLELHQFGVVNGRQMQTHSTEFGLADPTMAVAMAEVCERFGLPAAEMLNIRPGRLAAWRAHATRGTYAKTGS